MDYNSIRIFESCNRGEIVRAYDNQGGRFPYIAFGYSALIISSFVKLSGLRHEEYFSGSLQMPYIVFDDERCGHLSGHLCSSDEYYRWTSLLKKDGSNMPTVGKPKQGYGIIVRMSVAERLLKRCFDVVFSFLCIILLFPLSAILAFLVRHEDKGSVFLKQERLGKDCRKFYICKFRSIRKELIEIGPTLSPVKLKKDPRATRIGTLMRKYHLDEIPQLWNVLKGDMSVVGPRPEREYFAGQMFQKDKNYVNVFQLRPGIASYSYIKHGYADNVDDMIIRFHDDCFYMEHFSIWLDVKVIFLTISNYFHLK